ncbi:ABC transporter substrate-binding protein [Altererythrobacter sp. CC-YST694]|uniref:ABC transporter substrate-binding protein n=1 Tax=Altererythrobacter sp. CC-YST694 TaxID=2755038 RepID=UPI001D00EF7E|nr:ABC transporter substrate-binding protein [Altererythrobacter sp. CC-YST694]MCB5424170.1 ABC transporter substrate-binding protein [Altererythrobacter sp. CC-YST694]
MDGTCVVVGGLVRNYLVSLLVLSQLTGCSSALPPADKQRGPSIVSLNPCSDAILAEVAKPDQLLAISHYSHDPRASSMDPATARRFATTSGAAEEVFALKPDVVVASSFLPGATRRAFERLGIRVVTLNIAHDLAESEAQVRQLAALAGRQAQGEALVARIESALDKARPEPGSAPVDALVWQQGGLIAGPGSLIADLLTRTGFSSHAAARGLGQGAYLPLEQVLADPPDVVLAAGGERALAHPALKGLKATRYERLDPSLLFCGGPTIVRAVGRLAEVRAGLGAPALTGPARADVGRLGRPPLVLSLSKDTRKGPKT